MGTKLFERLLTYNLPTYRGFEPRSEQSAGEDIAHYTTPPSQVNLRRPLLAQEVLGSLSHAFLV